jgi:hypothetical protein
MSEEPQALHHVDERRLAAILAADAADPRKAGLPEKAERASP